MYTHTCIYPKVTTVIGFLGDRQFGLLLPYNCYGGDSSVGNRCFFTPPPNTEVNKEKGKAHTRNYDLL